MDQKVLPLDQAKQPSGDEFIRFEHVTFSYHEGTEGTLAESEREQCLYDINFALKRGESLGIIGPTGCGKTTIINLLMRFYDVEKGGVFVDGRDVRTYPKMSCGGNSAWCSRTIWCSSTPCGRTSALAGPE